MQDVKFHLTRQADGQCYLSLIDRQTENVMEALNDEDEGRLSREEITPLFLKMLSTAYHAGVERGIRAAGEAASAHWTKKQASYAPTIKIRSEDFDDYFDPNYSPPDERIK